MCEKQNQLQNHTGSAQVLSQPLFTILRLVTIVQVDECNFYRNKTIILRDFHTAYSEITLGLMGNCQSSAKTLPKSLISGAP